MAETVTMPTVAQAMAVLKNWSQQLAGVQEQLDLRERLVGEIAQAEGRLTSLAEQTKRAEAVRENAVRLLAAKVLELKRIQLDSPAEVHRYRKLQWLSVILREPNTLELKQWYCQASGWTYSPGHGLEGWARPDASEGEPRVSLSSAFSQQIALDLGPVRQILVDEMRLAAEAARELRMSSVV